MTVINQRKLIGEKSKRTPEIIIMLLRCVRVRYLGIRPPVRSKTLGVMTTTKSAVRGITVVSSSSGSSSSDLPTCPARNIWQPVVTAPTSNIHGVCLSAVNVICVVWRFYSLVSSSIDRQANCPRIKSLCTRLDRG